MLDVKPIHARLLKKDSGISDMDVLLLRTSSKLDPNAPEFIPTSFIDSQNERKTFSKLDPTAPEFVPVTSNDYQNVQEYEETLLTDLPKRFSLVITLKTSTIIFPKVKNNVFRPSVLPPEISYATKFLQKKIEPCSIRILSSDHDPVFTVDDVVDITNDIQRNWVEEEGLLRVSADTDRVSPLQYKLIFQQIGTRIGYPKNEVTEYVHNDVIQIDNLIIFRAKIIL